MNKRMIFWKTCRVIANETRLRLLWTLFEQGELCAGRLQVLSGMSQSNASNQLKLLNTYGLVAYRRKKMNVFYRAVAIEADSTAAMLIPALKRCCGESVPFREVIRQATAFTHERRIEIAAALTRGPLSFNDLMELTGMGSSALSRHLKKMEVRGFVFQDARKYGLARPESVMGSELLQIARSC